MRRFHRPPHRNSFIVGTCIALIGGVWVGCHGVIIPSILVVIVGCWMVALWRSAIWWTGLIIFGCTLGVLRADHYVVDLHRLTSHIGETVRITAIVSTDPVTDEKHRTQVRLSGLMIDGRPSVGTIKLAGYSLRLQRGFEIVALGKLKPGFATWDAEIDYGKVIVLNDHLPPLEHLRQTFFQGMRTTVPDPEAAFGLGLLVGVGALIPKPLQVELTRVGLSHLTAVSGYNLTIIIRLVMRLLGKLGPNVVMILSLWLIAVFVVISGASASIVRAGAIAYLSLIARRSGLRISPLVLIAITAAATLLYSPAYLRDAGWALSFLAFFGILVVAPVVMERYGEPKWILGKMLIETCAAEIMTLPYILVVFHQMSYVGIVANIIIEPIIPAAMAVAAIAAGVGIWAAPLIEPVGYIATHLLGFILSIIGTLAALPWAQQEISLSIVGAVMVYGLIVLLIWHMGWRSARRAQFAILEPDRSTQCLDTQNGPP